MSKEAYDFIRAQQMFPLPGASTLREWVKGVSFEAVLQMNAPGNHDYEEMVQALESDSEENKIEISKEDYASLLDAALSPLGPAGSVSATGGDLSALEGGAGTAEDGALSGYVISQALGQTS